jgi:hypothetical protein
MRSKAGFSARFRICGGDLVGALPAKPASNQAIVAARPPAFTDR